MRGRLAAGLALAALIAGTAAGASAERVAGTTNEHVLVGRSVQKRPIEAVQIGDPAGTRVALVVGVIHGDEPGGLRILGAIKRRAADERAALQGTQLWAIETVNPDGLGAHTARTRTAWT